jgi:hypothetical protein
MGVLLKGIRSRTTSKEELLEFLLKCIVYFLMFMAWLDQEQHEFRQSLTMEA